MTSISITLNLESGKTVAGPDPTLPPPSWGGGGLPSRSWAFNLSKYKDFSPELPYLDISKLSKWSSQPSRNDPARQSNGHPAEILAGDTELRLFNAWDADGFAPHLGRYVVRHSGLENYAFSLTNATVVSSSAGRIVFDVPTQTGWWITIAGPAGAVPAFTLEIVREDRESVFDNTGTPLTHATRIFNPDYLADFVTDKPHHLRFMKPMNTENALYENVADLVNLDHATYVDAMPIEAMVSLCNYLGCGLWFCQWHRASDALMDYCAEYIRANLAASLSVYIEEYNEAWNFGYEFSKYYWAEGLRKWGAAGAGTISTVNGSKTVTGVGTNFDTIFENASGSKSLTIGDRSFQVDFGEVITATSFTCKGSGQISITDNDWYHGRSNNLEGFAYKSSLTMQRWIAVFAASEQRFRLTTVLGARLEDGPTNVLLACAAWSGEPDFVAPNTVHDVVAVNPYFGSGMFNQADIKAAVKALQASSPGTPVNELYRDLMLGQHATLDDNKNLIYVRDGLKETRVVAESYGVGMISYEGGTHMVHSPAVNSSDTDILDSYTTFMHSPEAITVFSQWAELNMLYLDGPIMQFQHAGAWTRYGFWGMRPRYGYAGDSRLNSLRNYADKDPWWGPYFPPQWVLSVPDQAWEVGVAPTLNLREFCTANAIAFSGDSPPGTTLNSDGTFSGSPSASSPGTIYTFAVTNAGGSNLLNVYIEVP